jgi:hypothetical protein
MDSAVKEMEQLLRNGFYLSLIFILVSELRRYERFAPRRLIGGGNRTPLLPLLYLTR